MTDPEVKLDADLARLAEAVAAARGETLEDVVDRLVRRYVSDDGSYNSASDSQR